MNLIKQQQTITQNTAGYPAGLFIWQSLGTDYSTIAAFSNNKTACFKTLWQSWMCQEIKEVTWLKEIYGNLCKENIDLILNMWLKELGIFLLHVLKNKSKPLSIPTNSKLIKLWKFDSILHFNILFLKFEIQFKNM